MCPCVFSSLSLSLSLSLSPSVMLSFCQCGRPHSCYYTKKGKINQSSPIPPPPPVPVNIALAAKPPQEVMEDKQQRQDDVAMSAKPPQSLDEMESDQMEASLNAMQPNVSFLSVVPFPCDSHYPVCNAGVFPFDFSRVRLK